MNGQSFSAKQHSQGVLGEATNTNTRKLYLIWRCFTLKIQRHPPILILKAGSKRCVWNPKGLTQSLPHGVGLYEEARDVQREQRNLAGGEDVVVSSLKGFLPYISSSCTSKNAFSSLPVVGWDQVGSSGQ